MTRELSLVAAAFASDRVVKINAGTIYGVRANCLIYQSEALHWTDVKRGPLRNITSAVRMLRKVRAVYRIRREWRPRKSRSSPESGEQFHQ